MAVRSRVDTPVPLHVRRVVGAGTDALSLLHTDADAVGEALAAALTKHRIRAITAADMAERKAFTERDRAHVASAAIIAAGPDRTSAHGQLTIRTVIARSNCRV